MKQSISVILFSLYLAANPALSECQATSPKQIVKEFMEEVRSGKNPQNAELYLADTVLAHQVASEDPTTIKRTPKNYENHVSDFLKIYGKYSLEITEIIAEGDKVYVKWIQRGKHQGMVDGYPPTKRDLVGYASCVYLVKNNKITEYWIQIDRFAFKNNWKQARKSENDRVNTVI